MDITLKNKHMKNLMFLLLIFIASKCDAQIINKTISENLSRERRNLKNYAFCQCLRYSLKSDSLLIKDGSSAGYFEVGAYKVNAFEMIDSISKAISNKIYKSKEGKPLAIMKCLDFYNSKELDTLVNSLDAEIIIQRPEKK